jgi:hypothetical protein
MPIRSNSGLYLLIAGDIIALAFVTIVGFASHGTAGTAGIRMLTTLRSLRFREINRCTPAVAPVLGDGTCCSDGWLVARFIT